MLLSFFSRLTQCDFSKWQKKFDWVLHAGLGCLAVLSFAPFDLFPLIFISIGWVFAFLCFSQKTLSQKIIRLLAFYFGFFLTGVHWVYISIQEFGGMPSILALLTTLIFCLYLTLYPLGISLFFGWLLQRWPNFFHTFGKRGLLFSFLWVSGEILRSSGALGFPWLTVGYSQVPTGILTDYFPLIGIYGVSFLVVLTSTLLIETIDRLAAQAFKKALLPLGLMGILMIGNVFSHIYTLPTQKAGQPFSVSLLQGNIQQSLKFSPEHYVHTLETYYALLTKKRADLTILPETAFPIFYHQVPPHYLRLYDLVALQENRTILFGVPELDSQLSIYYNSVIQRDGKKQAIYRKTHLVPLGEYLPFPALLKPLMQTMNIPFSDFSSGTSTPQFLFFHTQPFGMSICYEDAFTQQIMQTATKATFLVNVSNDAWFGHSIAMYQHLQMAQARALESRKYLLRATNTGITAVINPEGKIIHQASPFQTEVLYAPAIQGFSDQTPYVKWMQWL